MTRKIPEWTLFLVLAVMLSTMACGGGRGDSSDVGRDLSTIEVPTPNSTDVADVAEVLVEDVMSDLPISDQGEIETTDIVLEDVSTCPALMQCVNQLPAVRSGNTATEPPGVFDSYACNAAVDESGPEVVYRVHVQEAGFLSAAVYEDDGVDVDAHILSALDPSACLDRGNYNAGADVTPGDYYVVVDTYVSGGVPQSGSYRVEIGLIVPSHGACDMQTGVMERVGDNDIHLAMPATGPVVQEAHLVTQDEPPPYPSTATENLATHWTLSQTVTGLVMHRLEKWAPMEGGDYYGMGIGSPTLFPALHEAWYVNMYWTSAARPARGTRMIIRLPDSDRAVVVAAGYETGPGDLSNIGGTVEEAHFYLGTVHQSVLTLGVSTDQTLPFGPRICE